MINIEIIAIICFNNILFSKIEPLAYFIHLTYRKQWWWFMENIVIEAISGDKEAFLQLVELRLSILYKIAYTYMRSGDDSSDVVQDSILKAYRNIKKLKDHTKFNSWITSILINRCKEVLRRTRKIRYEEYSDEIIRQSTSHIGSYSNIENSIDIVNSLQKLDEKYQDVITLKYFGDYSLNEISEILDIPLGTVKSRLSFGLGKLKLYMEVKADGM